MTILQIGWILGNAVLAGLGYFLKNSFDIQVGIALVNLPMICFFFCVPESPRWLLVTGKPNKAQEILHKIAHWNGADISVEFPTEFNDSWNEVISTTDVNTVYNGSFSFEIFP